MQHRKIVHVKAVTKPMDTTNQVSITAPIAKPMSINTEYVIVYVGIQSIDQSYKFEIATSNAEDRLYEKFGKSGIDIRADTTYILPTFTDFKRDVVMKVHIKHLPILLEEYAKECYHFEYDVVFDYGVSSDINGEDKDQYATVARIDKTIVGDEVFKMFAKMYIGEDLDISDIGYIQIQAPVVEYGK